MLPTCRIVRTIGRRSLLEAERPGYGSYYLRKAKGG